MSPNTRIAIVSACVAATLSAPFPTRAASAEPVFSKSGYAAPAYGEAQGFPPPAPRSFRTQRTAIGYYSHFDLVWPTETVRKAGKPSHLERAAKEISVIYPYNGKIRTIDSYLERNPVTGLLIARDDTILYEHYRYGRTDSDRFMSQSMAKTITSLLVGIALSEGAIHSIDDTAQTYVPGLRGSAYGGTTIRDLLHMSSGVDYIEASTQTNDTAKLGRAILFGPTPVGSVPALRQFEKRRAPPGTRFSYSSAETQTLGLVVSHAVHMSLAGYASSRLWQKLGMQADASWAREPTGANLAYCCFNATLRDWARLGLMLAHDGAWNGQQIVPRQWLLDATTVPAAAPYLAPGRATALLGYGYQVWLLPGSRRMFALSGMDGQRIIVDPTSKLVLVQTAAWMDDRDPSMKEVYALWNALLAQHGAP